MPQRTLIALALLAAGSAGSSAPVDAQNILQETLRDFRVDDAWIYDDWEAARELAAKSGKPIFAVFRCVP